MTMKTEKELEILQDELDKHQPWSCRFCFKRAYEIGYKDASKDSTQASDETNKEKLYLIVNKENGKILSHFFFRSEEEARKYLENYLNYINSIGYTSEIDYTSVSDKNMILKEITFK